MQQMVQISRQKEAESPNPKPNKTGERKRNRNDPLTKAEVELLLSKVDSLMEHTLLLFGFSSGVRVGEAVGFGIESINEQEGYVHIWDEKKNRYRDVYIPSSVIAKLKMYWNERGDRKSPKFFNISTKTAERIIQRWTEKVLLKRKSWHCVRHTYITLSQESEIPISIVIENTGDKPSTILEYYTKLSPTFKRDQIQKKPIFHVQ